MKSLIIAVGIVMIMVGILTFGDIFSRGTTKYIAPEKEVIEKEVVVDNTNQRIKKAQDEAMEQITAKADEMRQNYINNKLKEIESSVLKEVAAELEARSVQLDKETGAY